MKKRLLIIGLLNCIVFLWASDFEKRIDAVYWLTGYYNEVIQKRDRDVILKYIPKHVEEPYIFHYELDEGFDWYEDSSLDYYGRCIIGHSNIDNDTIASQPANPNSR